MTLLAAHPNAAIAPGGLNPFFDNQPKRRGFQPAEWWSAFASAAVSVAPLVAEDFKPFEGPQLKKIRDPEFWGTAVPPFVRLQTPYQPFDLAMRKRAVPVEWIQPLFTTPSVITFAPFEQVVRKRAAPVEWTSPLFTPPFVVTFASFEQPQLARAREAPWGAPFFTTPAQVSFAPFEPQQVHLRSVARENWDASYFTAPVVVTFSGPLDLMDPPASNIRRPRAEWWSAIALPGIVTPPTPTNTPQILPFFATMGQLRGM